MANGDAGGHGVQAQRLVSEALRMKALDGFEIVLAQGQRNLKIQKINNLHCKFYHLGASSSMHCTAHGVARIDQGRQVDAFEQLPHQCETVMAAQIVRQLFDSKINRFGHERFLHMQGKLHFGAKRLICMRIFPEGGGEVTDSG